MKFIEVPEFPILHGQAAIEALNEIIKEFEQQKGKELTNKQANALIKFANGLIYSIQTEMHSEAPRKNKHEHQTFFKKFGDFLPRLQSF